MAWAVAISLYVLAVLITIFIMLTFVIARIQAILAAAILVALCTVVGAPAAAEAASSSGPMRIARASITSSASGSPGVLVTLVRPSALSAWPIGPVIRSRTYRPGTPLSAGGASRFLGRVEGDRPPVTHFGMVTK